MIASVDKPARLYLGVLVLEMEERTVTGLEPL